MKWMQLVRTILGLGIGAGLLGYGGCGYWTAQAAASWPVATGKVTVSQAKTIDATYRQGRHVGASHHAVIRYVYAVEGVQYEGHRVAMGIGNGYQQQARARLDAYPVGKQIEVRYDPRNPARALLEPGQVLGLPYILGLGGITLWVGFRNAFKR